MKPIIKTILFSYVFVYSAIFFLYKYDYINGLFLNSAIYAGILNFVNSAAAFVLFEFSYRQKNKTFLIANLGGMGVRMMFVLLSIVLVVQFLEIDVLGFLLIFFLFYFILLSLEVFHFHKKVKHKNS